MDLSISRKVAQIVSEMRVMPRKKGKDGEVEVPHRTPAALVQISDLGSEAAKLADYIRALPDDPERAKTVYKLKETVKQGEYRMTEEMVNSIAERIARTLV